MTVRTFVIGDLCVSPFNVRSDGRAIGALHAMKQSILKRGLLMPLVVHPMLGDKRKFGAIAGGRRYRALKELIGEGKLRADFPIDAVVREGLTEGELIELSTAENIVRRDLYPYETYAALARARRRRSSFEDIAETLGQDVEWVRKGARLGMLPAKIFKAYAEDEISLECAKAFAATEDEKLQLLVFDLFQQQPRYQRNAALVRDLLKVGDRELTRLLRFVGEGAYRDAGGRFELDLFAEEDEVRGIVTDEGILRDLASTKLDEIRASIRARAGRDLRFAVEPPQNDFHQADASLRILPDEPLAAAEESRLADLAADQARVLDRVRALVDENGDPLPGNEPAIEALDEEYSAIEAAIAAIEAARPLILPEGDVIATLDVDDSGEAITRFWWASRKAQAQAAKPGPKPDSLRAAGPQSDRPLDDGAAITAPIGERWTGRAIADARTKGDFGLTQQGTEGLRSLRRAMLAGVLVEDAIDGGTVARDYFTWAQLRMLLTQARSASTGLKPIVAPDRDEDLGRDLIAEVTGDQFAGSRTLVGSWDCFTETDLVRAFAAFRARRESDKCLAQAILVASALERSLDADGYRIALHDVVASETGLAAPAQLREFGRAAPSARLLNQFNIAHRLDLAEPLLDRDTLLSWSKKKSGELTDLLLAALKNAPDWVHPLLRFASPAEPVTAPEARALEEVQ